MSPKLNPNITPPPKLARRTSGPLPLLGRKPNKGPWLPHLLLTFCSLWMQPSHFISPGRAWVWREEHQQGEDGGIPQLRTETKGVTLVHLQVYDWPGAAR